MASIMTTVICSDPKTLPFTLPVANRTIPFPDKVTFDQAIKAEDTWLISRWVDQIPGRIYPSEVKFRRNGLMYSKWFDRLNQIACLPNDVLNQYRLGERVLEQYLAFEAFVSTHYLEEKALHGDAFVYHTLFLTSCSLDYGGLAELLLTCPAVHKRLTAYELSTNTSFLTTSPYIIGAALAAGQYTQESLQGLASAFFKFYEQGWKRCVSVNKIRCLSLIETFLYNGLDWSFLEEKFPSHAEAFLAIPSEKRIVQVPIVEPTNSTSLTGPRPTLRALYAERNRRERYL